MCYMLAHAPARNHCWVLMDTEGVISRLGGVMAPKNIRVSESTAEMIRCVQLHIERFGYSDLPEATHEAFREAGRSQGAIVQASLALLKQSIMRKDADNEVPRPHV